MEIYNNVAYYLVNGYYKITQIAYDAFMDTSLQYYPELTPEKK